MSADPDGSRWTKKKPESLDIRWLSGFILLSD
jgi:hypothetical protein